MKTIVKIALLAVVGLVAIALVGMLLGMIGFFLKLLVPVVILAVVGWVVLKVLAGGSGDGASEGGKQAQLPFPTKDVAPPAPAARPPRAGMSAEEAARQFEELRKKP